MKGVGHMEADDMVNNRKTADDTSLFETARYFMAYQGIDDREWVAFSEDTDDKERRVAWK